MTDEDHLPVVGFEPSLGREARQGTLRELTSGTFGAAIRAFELGRYADAAALVEAALLEAEELLDVYTRWPLETQAWILDRGVSGAVVDEAVSRLSRLIGERAMKGIAAEWPAFESAITSAGVLSRTGQETAPSAIEAARTLWLTIHDLAVDRVSGFVDIAFRLVGEAELGGLWDHLMSDWYAAHQARFTLDNQPWSESARQLKLAIVDGFHAHLTGSDRSGDIELIVEPDRTGFRFAPCGSGGRSVARGITGDQPRAAAPFRFAVTTKPHDWAWNLEGVCSYCVHCCKLNELMPIDELGFPTRVIDPPTWPSGDNNPSCTWWVYDDPSLVPDAVYERVGRTPVGRPAKSAETEQ